MKDFYELYNNYLDIKEKGWIKSKRRGPGGVGYTFETLLGKEENSFSVPDFKSVEIKTMRIRSRNVLHLFCLTPDGEYLFPIKRVLDNLGYPSKWNSNYKVFMCNVNAKNSSKIGLFKKIKLFVNRENSKLELKAFKIDGNEIEINISWSFDLLKTTLERKLKRLAIIKAKNKFINDEEYFWYSYIFLYQLKSFETFLLLIENGIITITFNIDVFKNEKRYGQIYDHGTYFSINFADIEKLFDQIYLDVD